MTQCCTDMYTVWQSWRQLPRFVLLILLSCLIIEVKWVKVELQPCNKNICIYAVYTLNFRLNRLILGLKSFGEGECAWDQCQLAVVSLSSCAVPPHVGLSVQMTHAVIQSMSQRDLGQRGLRLVSGSRGSFLGFSASIYMMLCAALPSCVTGLPVCLFKVHPLLKSLLSKVAVVKSVNRDNSPLNHMSQCDWDQCKR